MGNLNSSEFGKTSILKVEGQNVRYGYYKNREKVLYDGVDLNLLKSELPTFKKLKYSYAKTNRHVFYKGQIIPEANPKTFMVLDRKHMPEEYIHLNSVIGMDFADDTKRIYQFGKRIFTIHI